MAAISGERPVKLLGAVIAGGGSRRFGSDKAIATLGKLRLIDHVIAAVRDQCDAVVVCGRPWPGQETLADLPAAELGPLGGLCAALAFAAREGYDMVLSVPCDVPDLPADLALRLADAGAPSYLRDLPVAGLWPSALAAKLDGHLRTTSDRAMWQWAALIGANAVTIEAPLANINTTDDLARRLRDGANG